MGLLPWEIPCRYDLVAPHELGGWETNRWERESKAENHEPTGGVGHRGTDPWLLLFSLGSGGEVVLGKNEFRKWICAAPPTTKLCVCVCVWKKPPYQRIIAWSGGAPDDCNFLALRDDN